MRDFKKLKIWQKGRELVKNVYVLLNSFPASERFVLVQQIQRSAISIPSNIAEGVGKSSGVEFARFMDIACGSACELETQLLIASDLNYMDENNRVFCDLNELQKMMYVFTKNIRK